jgi:hypothetical protein
VLTCGFCLLKHIGERQMEIIRYRTDEYVGLPAETVDDPSMNLASLGMLVSFLRHHGTDEVTPASLASQHGMGVKTKAKTLGMLLDGGYIAFLRTQSARGPWGAKMIVSEVPMTPGEIKAHINTLLGRGDVIAVQLMDAYWKTIPGMSFRKPKSTSANA